MTHAVGTCLLLLRKHDFLKIISLLSKGKAPHRGSHKEIMGRNHVEVCRFCPTQFREYVKIVFIDVFNCILRIFETK